MAWTEITRLQYQRDGLRYANDTTDAEWAVIAPPATAYPLWAEAQDLPAGHRQRDLLHRPKRLPVAHAAREFPPFTTVQRYFYAWRDDRTWKTINHVLLMAVREAAGCEASPTAGVSIASR